MAFVPGQMTAPIMPVNTPAPSENTMAITTEVSIGIAVMRARPTTAPISRNAR